VNEKKTEVVVNETIGIALIQMSCSEDVRDNYEKALGFIRDAARQGANIVCTQELFKSRYFPQVVDNARFGLAEKLDADNPTLKELARLAAELEIVLVAGLFERRAAGLYHNTAVVFDADGTLLGKYRKMHIPDDPLYYEKFYFTPGDLGYKVFHTRCGDIGVLICWDQWFPEAARLCALQGADIICIPTAIGYIPPQKEREGTVSHDAWQIVQRGHAVANACYVACVNRVGFEAHPREKTGIDFWGQSFVADPNGRVVQQASEEDEELLQCTIDLSAVRAERDRFSFPFRDRRIDSYGGLTQRYLGSG
jgi:N-carbamoylputrescine amidase